VWIYSCSAHLKEYWKIYENYDNASTIPEIWLL
jgi:NADH:ubiquinone oxidoreductase subunit